MRTEDAGAEAPAEREAVEWYFGDLVGDIALESPIARGRLLDALARLEASVSDTDASAEIRHRGSDECIVALVDSQWTTLTDAAELTDLEAATTRAVHRRMAEALGVALEERVPVVLIRPDTRRINESINGD